MVELICDWDSLSRKDNKRQRKTCRRLKAGEERGCEILKNRVLNSEKKLLPVYLNSLHFVQSMDFLLNLANRLICSCKVFLFSVLTLALHH